MAYKLEIHYIDVGQGDCTLILIRDEERMQDDESLFDSQIVQTIVLDCGTAGTKTTVKNESTQDYDPAEAAVPWRALMRKISELKVEQIDKIIISHYDKDHYNGFIFGFDRYQAARNRETPSNNDRTIIRLLENVRIYDQGISLFRSWKAFNTVPPEYVTLIYNAKLAPSFGQHADRLKNARNFKRDANNYTYNTGFDTVEHIQIKGENIIKDFSGRLNYLRYSQLIFDNQLSRETERVMVGHPTQWTENFHPFELDITPGNPENGEEGDERTYIEAEFWRPTASEGFYEERNVHYWGYRKSTRKIKVEGKKNIRQSTIDVHAFDPREVNVPGYNVQRLSPIHLLGKNLLEDLDSPEQPIQLTCIAANGFVWGTDNIPIKAYENSGDDNTFSLGFVLKFGNLVHWFGGDLKIKQEDLCIPTIQSMLGENGSFLMKASHHGSETSTSERFLNELRPSAVFVSAGIKYGHPHITTLNRLYQSTFVQHIFMTGTDTTEKMEEKGELPGEFPSFYSIYTISSRFVIAGSDSRPGDIALICTSEDALTGNCSVRLSNQNGVLVVDDPMPSPTSNISINPVITLNRTYQHIISGNSNNPSRNFISGVKRPRPEDLTAQLMVDEAGFHIPHKRTRRQEGRIASNTILYHIQPKKDDHVNE